jgi:hypothetical protein
MRQSCALSNSHYNSLSSSGLSSTRANSRSTRHNSISSVPIRIATTSLNSEAGVEDISGSLVLGRRLCGGCGAGAAGYNIRTSLAAISKTLADEVGNDANLLRRSVVKVGVVGWRESLFLATVKSCSKDDAGIGARPKVTGLSLLQGVGGFAFTDLGLALSDAAIKLARVGGVGTSVVLDIARPADSGTSASEGVAVDCEGSVAGGGDDGRSRAAEGASEGLDIGSS